MLINPLYRLQWPRLSSVCLVSCKSWQNCEKSHLTLVQGHRICHQSKCHRGDLLLLVNSLVTMYVSRAVFGHTTVLLLMLTPRQGWPFVNMLMSQKLDTSRYRPVNWRRIILCWFSLTQYGRVTDRNVIDNTAYSTAARGKNCKRYYHKLKIWLIDLLTYLLDWCYGKQCEPIQHCCYFLYTTWTARYDNGKITKRQRL